MEMLNVNAHLSVYILIVGLIAIGTVCLRYYRERDAIFLDSSTYFVLLMCLYVAVPAFIHVETGKTRVGASYETILFSAKYSLYFIFILTIYYLFKALRSIVKQKRCSYVVSKRIALVPINNIFIYGLYAVLMCYILMAFFLNYPGSYQMWSNRKLASAFSTNFNDAYKVQFIFSVVVSMIVYLTVKNEKNRYIIMLFPFIAMNLMTTDREFMYQTIFVLIGVFLLTKTKIPVVKLAIFSFITVSIGVARVLWKRGYFDFGAFLSIPGEVNTVEAGYVIIESIMSINFFESLFYSLERVFPFQPMAALFGGAAHFREIINVEWQLYSGIGGSLLSEIFSFKSYFLYIIYPFITIFILESINKIRYSMGFLGQLIFIFYLINTHSIFRSGIIFSSMIPIYYALYATIWYWLTMMGFINRVRHFKV